MAEHASDFDKIATDGDGKPMLFPSESNQDTTAFWGRTDFVWGSNRIDPTRDEFGAQEYYSGHQHDGDATNLNDVTGHYRAGDEDDPDAYGYLDEDTMHYRNLTHILSGSYQDILTTEEYIEDWVPMEDVLRDHNRGSSGS